MAVSNEQWAKNMVAVGDEKMNCDSFPYDVDYSRKVERLLLIYKFMHYSRARLKKFKLYLQKFFCDPLK